MLVDFYTLECQINLFGGLCVLELFINLVNLACTVAKNTAKKGLVLILFLAWEVFLFWERDSPHQTAVFNLHLVPEKCRHSFFLLNSDQQESYVHRKIIASPILKNSGYR